MFQGTIWARWFSEKHPLWKICPSEKMGGKLRESLQPGISPRRPPYILTPGFRSPVLRCNIFPHLNQDTLIKVFSFQCAIRRHSSVPAFIHLFGREERKAWGHPHPRKVYDQCVYIYRAILCVHITYSCRIFI